MEISLCLTAGSFGARPEDSVLGSSLYSHAGLTPCTALSRKKTITLRARKQEATSSFHLTIKNMRHGLTDKHIVPALTFTASAPEILFLKSFKKNQAGYDYELC